MDDPFQSMDSVLSLKDYKVERMILSTRHWGTFSCAVDLEWKPVPFSHESLPRIPSATKGVYSFVVQPGIANHPRCSYLLYIGKVERQGFRDRYSQYLREKLKGEEARRPHVSRMLQKWNGYLWFCYAEIDDGDLIEHVENALLAAYLPPNNRTFPSKIRYELKGALE